jgi:hypothetical protein
MHEAMRRVEAEFALLPTLPAPTAGLCMPNVGGRRRSLGSCTSSTF